MGGYPYLQVTANDEAFFVATAHVIEVTGSSYVAPMPLGPRALLGLMHLRGHIVLIVDLLTCLGRSDVPPRSIVPDEPLVIVRLGATLIGLRVDRVDGPCPEQGQLPFDLGRVPIALGETPHV